ncbi:MAG: LCP family protein [bacterium]
MRYLDLGTIKKKKRTLPKKGIFMGLILLFVLGAGFSFGKVFKPLAIFSQISGGSSLRSSDGRVNILILGLDKRDPQYLQTGILTDTIMLVSIGKGTTNNIKIVSIPRDLWVKIDNGQFSKINEVYAYGGITTVSRVVAEVTGAPVHYYILAGFDGFKDFINALGGITVNVENVLDDPNYPIEGKEEDKCGLNLDELTEEEKNNAGTYTCRYENLHFDKGKQVFDGETALKYARSRHGYNGEGTDFARAKRQQNIIIAVKNKLLSSGILANPIKIKELYDIYKKYVSTDIGIGEIDDFYTLSTGLNLDDIKMVVIDNKEDENSGGLLFSPQIGSLYGGKSVLIPKAGDFSQIHSFIQKFLFTN